MKTREDLNDDFTQMVEYLLNSEPTKDKETIENYTLSLMSGVDEYVGCIIPVKQTESMNDIELG